MISPNHAPEGLWSDVARARSQIHRMAVIVLAGDFGYSDRPLGERPTPMTLVAGRPVLERILNHLHTLGFRNTILALYHGADEIAKHFSRARYGEMQLRRIVAKADLGSAGVARQLIEIVEDDRFLLISADGLVSFDYPRMVQIHLKRKSFCTVGLVRSATVSRRATVFCDKHNRVIHYLDASKAPRRGGCWINPGACIIEREALERVSLRAYADLDRDLIPGLLHQGAPVHGNQQFCQWFDLRDPRHRVAANRHYAPAAAQAQATRPAAEPSKAPDPRPIAHSRK